MRISGPIQLNHQGGGKPRPASSESIILHSSLPPHGHPRAFPVICVPDMSYYNNNYNYGGGGINYRLWIGIIIAAVSVIGYFTHTSVNPVTGETQHLSMTPNQEMQLGLQSAPE